MSPRPVRITLEVDAGVEPLRGSMSVEGAPARAFSGWIGLGRELELVLAAARDGERGPCESEPVT